MDEILPYWALPNGSYEGRSSQASTVTFRGSTGNNFGSLLFLTYVNDLPDRLHSEVKLFADDALLYGVIVKDTDCGQLQEDLQNLEQ